MAYTLCGNDPIDRVGAVAAGTTYMDKTVPIASSGVLKSAQVFMATGTGPVKIKVFRDDGTNYVFVGESAGVTVAVGLNTIPCWIPVMKGDFIALYATSGTLDVVTTGGTMDYQAGDITTTTLKTAWTENTYTMSVNGTIFHRVGIL